MDSSHSGVYTCVGQGEEGNIVRVTTKVFVVDHEDRSQERHGDCKTEGPAPAILGWYNTIMVPMGQTAVLECNVKVKSKPSKKINNGSQAELTPIELIIKFLH